MHRFLLLFLTALITTANGQATLTARDLSGTPQSLESLQGKIVVLNFWATWCVPCKAEMKLFNALQEKQHPDLVVVADTIDDLKDRKQIEKFVKKNKMQMPVWVGTSPEQMEELTRSQAVPATLFIDRDGSVISTVLGQIREQELDERVQWLLSDRSTPPPAKEVNHSQ